MALDDLDLEFEDEEEQKKKKNDAVHVDVDLEFAAPEGVRPKTVPQGRPAPPGRPQAAENVTKIDEVRTNQVRRPAAPSPTPPSPGRSPVQGANALKLSPDVGPEIESQQMIEMREQMRKMEIESQVKVLVAEFKTDYLSEMLSDMKLMEYQIGQLIARIHAKFPESKNEALMIKKILADFTSKKRK